MKTGFIGLGLIGGSIARAVRHFYPDAEIIAYSRTRASVEQAVADGVVDRIPDGVGEDFADCDYIFLCAPVSSNAKYLEQLKPIIHSSCIITDAWLSHVTSPTVVSLSSQKLIPVIPNSF